LDGVLCFGLEIASDRHPPTCAFCLAGVTDAPSKPAYLLSWGSCYPFAPGWPWTVILPSSWDYMCEPQSLVRNKILRNEFYQRSDRLMHGKLHDTN
jgi:hypothetical protein